MLDVAQINAVIPGVLLKVTARVNNSHVYILKVKVNEPTVLISSACIPLNTSEFIVEEDNLAFYHKWSKYDYDFEYASVDETIFFYEREAAYNRKIDNPVYKYIAADGKICKAHEVLDPKYVGTIKLTDKHYIKKPLILSCGDSVELKHLEVPQPSKQNQGLKVNKIKPKLQFI